MLTLHIFGRMPNVPLPDPSPFCMKADVLLKMAGVPYRVDTSGFGKAPKGKQPYIVFRDRKIPDSTFIRWHLEQEHLVDFDKGLSDQEKAIAWAFEKMCEDHLYQAAISERWLDDENFKIGPANFFNEAPALLRPLIAWKVRRDVRKAIYAHGIGRHTNEEIAQLAARDIAALATWRQALFHGRSTNRHRCHRVRFRRVGAVPGVQDPHPHGRRKPPQPRCLQCADDGQILP
jgi:Glutathione S-transferase N-terminal domain